MFVRFTETRVWKVILCSRFICTMLPGTDARAVSWIPTGLYNQNTTGMWLNYRYGYR